MLKRILVPLDGSKRAEHGLALAARLARGSGSELLIVRVVSVPPVRFAPYGEPAQIALALIATARDEAERYLNQVRTNPVLEGLSIEIRVTEGHVTADILDIARDEHCDMIVICSHSRSGLNRWRLGRVAEQVARHSTVPVLVMPPDDNLMPDASATAPVRILVTLDGSELAEAAIQPAVDLANALAKPEQITIHLLQVVDFFAAMMEEEDRAKTAPPETIGAEEHVLEMARAYLQARAESIQQANPGVTVTTVATLGADTAKMICDTAGGTPRYDYIAMATHGRGGLQRWALGSITERVLHVAHLPLLIARSPVAVKHDLEVAEAKAEADLHR